MCSIYIDVRHSFSVSGKSGKYNGGNNYSKRVIGILADCCASDERLILICTVSTLDSVRMEIDNDRLEYISTENLADIHAGDDDKYYTPQMNDSPSYKRELERFKKKNPNVKIYITIHDRRHMDNWFDRYDSLLRSGIKRIPFVYTAGKLARSVLIENALRGTVRIADKVFTVSNYSMQSLVHYKRIRHIKWFYQGIYRCHDSRKLSCGNYMLFVSGGRPEKNLIRTLLAFEEYVKQSGNDSVKIICTGISAERKQELASKLKLDPQISKNQIDFRGYVSQEQLDSLYEGCRFLIFTSKSEGFGLPVLEASLRYKPVLASNRSAIPEVIGAAGTYVNPYDISAICEGIAYLMDDDNYQKVVSDLQTKKEILQRQIELDDLILAREILG